MGLVKRTYVDGETVITAENLNAIQDAIIANEEAIEDQGEALNHKADAIYDTASGDIASFPDGADGLPVKDLTVAIEPVQSGTGDPSPTNVRPISGWTGANVTRTGKNLLPFPYANGTGTINGVLFTVNSDGSITANGTATADVYFRVSDDRYSTYNLFKLAPGNYTLSDGFPSRTTTKFTYVSVVNNGTVVQSDIASTNSNAGVSGPNFTITDDLVYTNFRIGIKIASGTTVNNVTIYPMIRFASDSSSTFESYQQITTIPISWQSSAGTVYGGTLDVTSGVLTVSHGIKDLGSLDWTRNSSSVGFYYFKSSVFPMKNYSTPRVNPLVCSTYKTIVDGRAFADIPDDSIYDPGGENRICVRDDSYTDADVFKSAMSGVQLVYELATPQSYQLTPQEVTTLLGQNNIWADCGPSTVEYPCDTKTYVDNGIGEVENTLNSKADEESLALRRSGATNTRAQIEKGTFFYLDGTLKHAIATIAQNASFTAQNCETVTAGGLNELYSYISERIIPTGTISMSGIICKSGSVYEIIIYLPSIIITSNSVTITCSEFRPGGQTAVKDTNPTVSKKAGTNTIIVYTTNSSFASYVGAEGVATLTFIWK